jgi:hypothetical protein
LFWEKSLGLRYFGKLGWGVFWAWGMEKKEMGE